MAGWAIPEDFPLGELMTQELTNVSIGRHFVRLLLLRANGTVPGAPKYKNDAAIEIEEGFQLITSDGRTIVATNSDLATGATALIELLGQTITSVDRCPNNELSLVFSDKAVLRLTVNAEGFESYHLHVGGQSVDVTKDW
jgi:hypothetical protein